MPSFWASSSECRDGRREADRSTSPPSWARGSGAQPSWPECPCKTVLQVTTVLVISVSSLTEVRGHDGITNV